MDQDPSASTAEKSGTEIPEASHKDDSVMSLNEDASDTTIKDTVETDRLSADETDKSSRDELSKVDEVLPSEKTDDELTNEAENKTKDKDDNASEGNKESSEVEKEVEEEAEDKAASPEESTQDRLNPSIALVEDSPSESPKSHSPQSREGPEETESAENPLDLDEDEENSEKSPEIIEVPQIEAEKTASDDKTVEEVPEGSDVKTSSKDTEEKEIPDSSLKDTEAAEDDKTSSEDSAKTTDQDKTVECSSKATDDAKHTESSSTASEVEKNDKTSESKKPTDEVMLVDSDKEDDKQSEPEKTEFVQITHDKQDESPTEGQSIEAEDPFGGDTPADAVEPMDTEELNERNRSFSQLGDEADNLQDVVKATTSSEAEKPVDEESKSSEPEDKQKDTEEKEKTDDKDENKEKEKKASESEEVIEEIIEIPASSSKSSEEAEKSKTKDKNTDVEVIPVESEEQSTVLPGQDDELCIIPDDMKIILPIRPKPLSKISAMSQEDDAPSKSTETSEKTAETVSDAAEAEKAPEAASKEPTAEEKSKEPTPAKEITDNVIDIEDESKQSTEIEEIAPAEKCKQCGEEKPCKIRVKSGSDSFSVCSKRCQNSFMETHGKATDIPSEGANSKYEKRCASCLLIVESYDDRNLQWETMEFCNEECLGKFQTKYGSYCRNCNGNVQPISLGKYCVRFGYDVRQFCCSTCLEEFKKGLKVCSYCQKDISSGTDGFLAPVGDKGQFKDFCTQQCMEKYSRMNSLEPPPAEKKACSVCQEEKIVFCEVQIDRGQGQAICSEPCFAAFKFVNKVDPDQCSTCKKYFQVANKKSTVVFYNNEAHTFCNKSCLNIFIITNRKIVPCNWCKVKKYNFDMIRKELKTGQVVMMCSLNCLTLYQVSINAVSAKRIKCDLCKEFSQAQYHLTMSDATIRNFCSYNCVMKFQAQYTKSPITIPAGDDAPVPTGMPKRTYPGKVIQGVVKKAGEIQGITNIQAISSLQSLQSKKSLPVISSVASLASLASNGQPSITQKATTNVVSLNNATITNPTVSQPQVIFKQQVITRPTSPVQVHNKMTQCKPLMHTKGVSVKPHPCTKSTQTDEVKKVYIPIPVPIYVPFPMHMFSFPFPVPMPFPLPIPVPIFIPTTKNSSKAIFKDLKRIQEKMPSDPFEAELLMMAEMVATEKKKTDSDSDSSDNEPENEHEVEEKPENSDAGNAFGEEMLQMALNMASGDLEEPAVDLEAALTSNTITATPAADSEENDKNEAQARGRKRTVACKSKSVPNKKGRRSSSAGEPLMPPPESQSTQVKVIEPPEKPDANMALKYTFGVNAWRQWVISKNTELEKQINTAKKVKLFKTDLLQLTADELNYSLCLFVKEVRKPNGTEYAPDTIYYLCLGIQQYLFENNRIDNIFTDTYYEKFTDCLNEVASKFSVLYNDAQYIVTRVEEEHLWECKQLGAHSPHVLLSTLMFFNTKHFNLVTVEEHMQLSFSHIMKHWKRNPAVQGGPKAPGARNVLLRFYPPQAALEANSRKKKVYEQQENEDNPLRCPVKLYEFYLSKCPESVKTRNDVFYLLPERSCVPDSPVWYSTSPLAKENLVKMLNRVKMVKEINVALLGS